jgi:endonuclease/exonuclease/phosphatase family protein
VRKLLAAACTMVIALVACSDDSDRGGHAPEGPAPELRIVTWNILHGLFCAPETDDCQGDDRVALLGQQLVDARCPQVVALEEIDPDMYERITGAPWLRDCGYEIVWHNMPLTDRELVLTSLPVTGQRLKLLAGDFRTAYRVELESDLGPVVLVVTHQDGDPEPGEEPRPCDTVGCPEPCPTTASVEQCQTIQVVDLAESGGGSDTLRVLTGDFNVTATNERYRLIVDGGWTDSHLEAGNRECDPATGIGCTSGRRDFLVDDLKNPDAQQIERIDYIFVKGGGCAVRFDSAGDDDADGIGTGVFDPPATDGPGGLVYVSDHSGISADMFCPLA